MKTLTEKINYIKIAPNMVQIECVLNLITEEYLNRYANEIELAPNGDYSLQSKWIEKAVRFFISDIHRDKLTVWNSIPERFYKTHIYQRLSLSQFVI